MNSRSKRWNSSSSFGGDRLEHRATSRPPYLIRSSSDSICNNTSEAPMVSTAHTPYASHHRQGVAPSTVQQTMVGHPRGAYYPPPSHYHGGSDGVADHQRDALVYEDKAHHSWHPQIGESTRPSYTEEMYLGRAQPQQLQQPQQFQQYHHQQRPYQYTTARDHQQYRRNIYTPKSPTMNPALPGVSTLLTQTQAPHQTHHSNHSSGYQQRPRADSAVSLRSSGLIQSIEPQERMAITAPKYQRLNRRSNLNATSVTMNNPQYQLPEGVAVVAAAPPLQRYATEGNDYHLAYPREPSQQQIDTAHPIGEAPQITANHRGFPRVSSGSSSSGDETISATGSTKQQRPSKSSRYLREMDRRMILSRIDQGEKQATLAKEYQVSRAAICNLNKHRDEVMSRKDENPLAKHPKKPRPQAKNRPGNNNQRDFFEGNGQNIYELNTRSLALLHTTLRNRNATSIEFRRSADRMIRLLIEEALASVPIKDVEVLFSENASVGGVSTERPPCGIAMSPFGSPMLNIFHLMEPKQPTGYIQFDDSNDDSNNQSSLSEIHLPFDVASYNIFLFDLVARSANTFCAAIDLLVERGAGRHTIWLVTLSVSSQVLAVLQAQYPTVKVVTVQIESSDQLPHSSRSRYEKASSSPWNSLLQRFHREYQL